MMRFWLLILGLCVVTGLWAQPANDDCGGVIDLGVAPACPPTFFSNVGATASDIGFGNIPNCFNGGNTNRDVWFAFTTSDTIFDYTITITGLADGADGPLTNPQVALYRGDCTVDGLAELLCASAAPGQTTLELDAIGLTPNVTYFLRINDYSASAAPNAGAFQLCVDEVDPINTIDQGSSTACSGELYDTGGPDGDYSNNENHTFTICPNEAAACITFSLEYYNIETGSFFGSPDLLNFFDGDTPSPFNLIASLSGGDFADFDNGGGVCFQVQATSGCLTVQFISDGTASFEGFAGSWVCSAVPCEPINPITVGTEVSNLDITGALSTPLTQVTITNIDCADGAYGVFDAGDNSDLGLQRGLLLTTGRADYAAGPNNSPGFTDPIFDLDSPGDPDLDALSLLFGAGTVSEDACVIELDVVAATDELTFEYIFGSEEYPEFALDFGDFNDIFAFLISGPGITGLPELNNQFNIATLPTPDQTVVQINSVNSVVNWEFYRDNQLGQGSQYDGLTSDFLGVKKSLTARSAVIPCNTYHLKLAIADRGDSFFDSGVFISELRGGAPDVAVRFNSGIDYLVEDCTSAPDELIIRLNNALEDTVTYNVVVGGTATPGVDYDLILPASITFLPGQTEFVFPLTVLSDLEVEDTETITVALVNDFGCGEVTYTTLNIELRDRLSVEINAGRDTAFYCPNGSVSLQVEGAAQYFWTPVPIFDNPISATPVATPTADGWVQVVGQLGAFCTDIDSIYLQLVNPTVELEALDPVAICQGDSVRLQATNNVANAGLSWSPTAGLNDPTSATPLASPLFDTRYIVTVALAGCAASDTLDLDVNFLNVPQLTSPDTALCQNYPVILASLNDLFTDETTYAWTPTAGLDDPNSPTPVATPDLSTTYQLIATSVNGACADTLQAVVNILAADVEIAPQDTAFICLGDIATLTAATNTGSATGLSWAPATGLSATTGLTVTTTPGFNTSGWYTATFVNGPCTVFDSVYVRVDSLPTDLGFTLDPLKEFYCAGELVTIRSPLYDPADFPDIQHRWTQGLGFQTPDSLYNLVFNTVDTVNYQRITLQNACSDTVNLVINVIEPILPVLTPEQSAICLGQSVQLTVTYEGQGELSWAPTQGLSCDDCPNPLATPTANVVYTVTASVDGECPQEARATILVETPANPALTMLPPVCPGEPVRLLLSSPEPGVQYNWSTPNNPAFSSDDPLLTVSPQTSTTYVLRTQQAFCPPVERSVTIEVIPVVSLALPADTTLCLGNNLTLTPLLSPAVRDFPETFRWQWADSTAETATLTVAPTETTTYTLIYQADDCQQLIASLEVMVEACGGEVPNIFSPNGDGVNDRFRIFALQEPTNVSIRVFNRWGQLVFDGNDNTGWDGNFKGDPAPVDVYIYEVRALIRGELFEQTGELTLLR